ncbi:MAG: ABC transporter permease [Clostridiaceae bacterium]|nr:ABC transporter permease [Clostridiaceae bacterium]
MIKKRDWEQFKTIFSYEYMGIIKNKVYLITTIIIMVVVAVVLTTPTVVGMFKSDDEPGDEPGTDPGVTDKLRVAVINNSGMQIEEILNLSLPNYNFVSENSNLDDLKDKVNKEEYYAALVMSNPLEFDLYVKDYVITNTLMQQISSVIEYNYKITELQNQGVSLEEIQRILASTVKSNLIELGKSSEQTFLYAYILLMFLYIAVNLYGQLVATSVATEKSSRAMELLISSAKPLNFMFGKILGSGTAGLTQLVGVMGVSFGFYKINESTWSKYPLVTSLFDMPADVLFYTILFFLLGYFLYAFIYGAVGSLVSRIEDVNTSILPVTFLYMAGFLVSMVNLVNPKGLVVRIFSFIPFFSPMCMFLRIIMTSVPIWEIAISIAILVATIIFTGYVAAKIYRVGVLMYGKPPKIKELVKVLKTKE